MQDAPTLLVTSPSTGGYYFGAMLGGIAREAAAVGGRVIVVQTLEPGVRSDEIGEPPAFSAPVAWAHADGAVSVTTAVRTGYLSRLRDSGVPVAVASIQLDGLRSPTAMPDNHAGAMAAVEHLLSHGHTRIAFVGNLAQQDIRDRQEAWRTALMAHGLTPDPALVLPAGDNAETGGIRAAAALLACPDRPTAVFAATDRNAAGLLHALSGAGLEVPRDLAVVGFDNIEAASYTTPPLTTVDQPFDQVGSLAARLVLDQVDGADVPAVPHISPANLVVRESCGCAASPVADAPTTAAGSPGATARDTAGSPREATEHALLRPVLTGIAPLDAATRADVEALMDRLDELPSSAQPTPSQVAALTTALRRLAPRPDVLRRMTRLVDKYLVASGAPVEATAPGRIALRDVQSAAFLEQSTRFELKLDEQFGVDAGLLDADGSRDPRDLAWLQGTHVSAGLLALWADDPDSGALRVVGTYDPDGVLGDLDERTTAEHFPPLRLVDSARPEERRVCVVVPVRTREREWGLLAVVAEIELSSARETYHHWAALLAAALDQRALQAAVRASERRYALAARAAKDGLWELDTAAGRLYLSERCHELLGGGAAVRDLEDWQARTHPDDTAAVAAMLTEARTLLDRPVELEYRVAVDGGFRWVLTRCLGVGPPGGPVERLVGSVSDIDPRKELEEQLRQGALYDTVTGLPNRRLFLERLAATLAARRRRPETGFAVIFLDLDGFKLVNDSLGHLMGDELLRTVAERLQGDLRSVDTAARFGGDEFAVLLTDPVPGEVLAIAQRIQSVVAVPVVLGDQTVSVTASIGITTSETPYTEPEDVLRDADIAMYQAKETERGTASVFDPHMHAVASERLRTRSEVRTALAEHQFVVHYQPIVPLDGSALAHFEALVRWQHPERGLLPPGQFLPTMEEDSSIVSLGQWLVDEVCRQVAAWRRDHQGPVAVSVNLSHREFWSEHLHATVTGALQRHDVPPESLVLEITESVVMADPAVAREVMERLRAAGLRLHIDDFGTGQSSLNALRTLPVDALKIDGSFVRELGQVDRTNDLVQIMLYMGQVLSLDVIAECVETTSQADRLQTMGCSTAQGWLYARAVPGDQAGALLGTALAPATAPVPPEPTAVGG